MNPCTPSSWPGFTIDWRADTARYAIAFENPDRRCRGVASVELDGVTGDRD